MDKLLTKLATAIVYLFLTINAILVLGPVLWTVLASFKPGNNLFSSSFGEFAFTLDHYKALFTDTPYLEWYKKHLLTCYRKHVDLTSGSHHDSLCLLTLSLSRETQRIDEHFGVANVSSLFIDDGDLHSVVKNGLNRHLHRLAIRLCHRLPAIYDLASERLF